MTRSRQAKLLILAVFVIGVLIGGVLTELYESRLPSIAQSPDADRQRPEGNFQRFEDFLELDEEQSAQLDTILRDSRERYRELQSRTRPMYRDLTEQSNTEIRGILTDEQLVLYEEWTRRIEEVRSERGGRGGRGRDDR